LVEELMAEAEESCGLLGTAQNGTPLISATMLHLQMKWSPHPPAKPKYRLGASFGLAWVENWPWRLVALMVF
jgi:hypothetical protein